MCVSLCLMTNPETECRFFVGAFSYDRSFIVSLSGLKQVHTKNVSISWLDLNPFPPHHRQFSLSALPFFFLPSFHCNTIWGSLHLNQNSTWMYMIVLLNWSAGRWIKCISWEYHHVCMHGSKALASGLFIYCITPGVTMQSGSRCGKTHRHIAYIATHSKMYVCLLHYIYGVSVHAAVI